MNLVIKILFALSLVGSLAAYSQGKSGDLKVQPQVNQSNTEVTMSDNNPFAKEQKPWLQAEIQSNYALFYLYVNGIRVYGNETPSAATNITLSINKYLKKGENSIKITMLTPPEKWAKDAVRLGKTSEVSIQIQAGPFDKSRQNYNLNKLNFTASPDSYSSDTTELGDTTKQAEWFFDAKSAEFVTAKSDQTPLVMVSQPQIEAGKVFNQYQGQPENIYKMAKGVAISQDINLPLPFPEWAWMRADKLGNVPKVIKCL